MSKHTTNNGTRWSWSRLRQFLAEDRWVDILVDFGKPVVLVVVLGMSVPSEHRIGQLSGYGRWAWAMPVVYAVYAALCAGIAGSKEKGQKGRGSAIAGAAASLALAMCAQVFAHFYDLGIWDDRDPKDRIWLVIAGSVVGALVLAHLVHVAAGGVLAARARREQPTVPTPTPAPVLRPAVWAVAPVGVQLLAAGCVARTAAAAPTEDAGDLPYGWVTTAQAAKLTGRATSTVRGWVSEGIVVSQLGPDGTRWIDQNSLPQQTPRQLVMVGAG